MWLTAGVWGTRRARSSAARETEAGRGSSGLGYAVSASKGLVEGTEAAARRARVCRLTPAAEAQVVCAPTRLASPPPHQQSLRTAVKENGAVAAPSALAPLDLCGRKKHILCLFMGYDKSKVRWYLLPFAEHVKS